MVKLFFDFEFTGLHQKTTPISLGIVSDDESCNQSFYCEFQDYNHKQLNSWIQENVIAKLKFPHNAYSVQTGGRSSTTGSFSTEVSGSTKYILKELKPWLAQFDQIQMWGDCLAYDWVLWCELFGGALNLPKNIYYIPFDISTLMVMNGVDPDINREEFAWGEHRLLQEQKHNALFDAKTIKAAYQKLTETFPFVNREIDPRILKNLTGGF